MSKVKLTKRQAFMISNHKNHLESLITKRYNANCATSVDDLSFDDILSAYFEGYEVEEEFKVGNYVIDNNLNSGIITEVFEDMAKVSVWASVEEEYFEESFLNVYIDQLSLLEEKEIEAVKKTRFWRSNNRDVWELKKGDILKDKNLYYYSVIQPNLYKPAQNETRVTGGFWITDEDLEENYKVACFAHNREDLKND